MFTKRDRSEGIHWLGLAILAVGVAIGMLLRDSWNRPVDAAMDVVGKPELVLSENLVPALEPEEVADNGLETLSLTIDRESAEVLQNVRNRAMHRGIIVQTDEDTVPAFVSHGGTDAAAMIRIKGDWTDHITTDKWSLRIKLEDERLFGMRVFSIQRPKARGFLWEWFVLAAFRREGVLSPRSTFVNVVINDNYAGVYYLEEHPSKELLEAQGRREGPIVLWDEQTRWETLLQSHNVYSKDVRLPVPASSQVSLEMVPPFVRAYGEKRLAASEGLTRAYYSAVEKMSALQRLVLLADETTERMKRLQALDDLQGATIDSLIDVDRVACAHALASLFQIKHALYWQNMRFYHDPVLDRLEPILFDNMAQEASGRDPVMFRRTRVMPPFEKSAAYYHGLFRYLGLFCEPGYLDEFFAEVLEDAERFEAAIEADDRIPAPFKLAAMLQRVRTQQAYLRNVIYPSDPISFTSEFELDSTTEERVTGVLEVTAWSTTRAPVVVEGFRFSNGRFAPARATVEPGTLGTTTTDGGGVVLPTDGRTVTFRFPMDERLANLENVGQVIQSLKSQTKERRKLDLDVKVVYRCIASDVPKTEKLDFRKRDAAWATEGERPETPTLAQALERHPFLEYEAENGRLSVRKGDWIVSGDLVVPSGVTLYAEGPVRLQFEEDAVLLTDAPLIFEGNWEAPVVLEPIEGAPSWDGIVVLRSRGRSTWQHAEIRRTQAVNRTGWVTTGGITFYRSPVTMRHCLIEGTLAEDGMNIFGADFLLDRVTFTGCVSDSFDGDFVTGRVVECTFRDGLADGVDFSGSDVDVIGCTFLRMGDKAISAGEKSTVRIEGGLAEDVSIGIASKDQSSVEVSGMTIRRARNYALAAFIKKSEFGASSLVANGLLLQASGLGDWIAQTGCVIEIDGLEIPTADLDVAKLYEDKILGQ